MVPRLRTCCSFSSCLLHDILICCLDVRAAIIHGTLLSHKVRQINIKPLIWKLIGTLYKITLTVSQLIAFSQQLKLEYECVSTKCTSYNVFSEYITSWIKVFPKMPLACVFVQVYNLLRTCTNASS